MTKTEKELQQKYDELFRMTESYIKRLHDTEAELALIKVAYVSRFEAGLADDDARQVALADEWSSTETDGLDDDTDRDAGKVWNAAWGRWYEDGSEPMDTPEEAAAYVAERIKQSILSVVNVAEQGAAALPHEQYAEIILDVANEVASEVAQRKMEGER